MRVATAAAAAVLAVLCTFASATPNAVVQPKLDDIVMSRLHELMAGRIGSTFADAVQPHLAATEMSAQLGGAERIFGTFITECYDLSEIVDNQKFLFSASIIYSFDYNEDPSAKGTYGYVADVTYYQNDDNCLPGPSDTIAKFVDTQRVTYLFKWGTFMFPRSPYEQRILDDLNRECACGKPFIAGVPRNITKGECKPRIEKPSDFCRALSGQEQFGNYQWVDATHDEFYVNQAEWSNRDGWSNPVNTSWIISKVPQQGATDPDLCDYVAYGHCEGPIKAAAKNCDTCYSELECTGCIYRELPDEKYNTDWNMCCACIWAYAKENKLPWMEVPC